MAPLRDSYLSRLMQTFITEIALLIYSPSVSPPFSFFFFFFFLSQRCLNLGPPEGIRAFISRPGVYFKEASARNESFPPVTVPVTAHTCSVALMAMTEPRERLGVASLAHFLCHLATWAIRAPRMCRCRFVPVRWRCCGAQTALGTQSVYFHERITPATCCTHTWLSAFMTSRLYFDSLISLIICSLPRNSVGKKSTRSEAVKDYSLVSPFIQYISGLPQSFLSFRGVTSAECWMSAGR